MEIYIEYILKNTSEWKLVSIKPEHYFDLDHDEQPQVSDKYHNGSVPIYDDTYQYLEGVEANELVIAKTVISNGINKKTFNEVFYNDGNNIFCEVVVEGDHPYREIIITSLNLDKNKEIMRYVMGNSERSKSMLLPTYHGFFSKKDNHSLDEIETEIDVKFYHTFFDRVLPL